MYYNYLNREQLYLRSYRTHNLWFDQYHKKVRTPRITSFHIGFFKRLGKTYSGVSRISLVILCSRIAPSDGQHMGLHLLRWPQVLHRLQLEHREVEQRQ